MAFNPDIHHRRSIRLKEYDYSSAGAYFVTLCAFERECLFGEIIDGAMRLNDLGVLVDTIWSNLPERFIHVSLDEYVVMPNHFHGIILLSDTVGAIPTGRPDFPVPTGRPDIDCTNEQGRAVGVAPTKND